MEDKRKAYKGIKFLKVDNQFLGAQLRKSLKVKYARTFLKICLL